MKVHQVSVSTGLTKQSEEPLVMALGMFDGVHLAHMKLLEEAKTVAQRLGLKLGVMTFFPHPRVVIASGHEQVQYLTPLKRKLARFAAAGVDESFVVQFDHSFAALSPHEFVSRFLLGHIQHAVVGFDFRYGHKGAGNAVTLKEQGKGFFDVTVMDEMVSLGSKISSTQIRKWIAAGLVELVPKHLGRRYEVTGTVEMVTTDRRFLISLDDEYMLPPSSYYEFDLLSANDVRMEGMLGRLTDDGYIVGQIPIESEYLGQGESLMVIWNNQRWTHLEQIRLEHSAVN